MCRSGLLRLNAKSSSCVVRKPKMVRAAAWACLLLRTMPGRENAKDNATIGGIYVGLEQFGVGAAERSAAFALLGVMVVEKTIESVPASGLSSE
jgi:hypothetical protein